jgi:uncharacterized protein YjeT (DUF2065 family)
MSTVRVAIALSTVVLGLVCIAMPKGIRGLTGLAADTPRALSEIRAFGGGFVGLGLAPLLWPQPAVYHTLGLAYLVTAVVRLVSIVADRSYAPSNWASLVLEVAFGLALFA